MISFDTSLWNILGEAPNASTFKVFLFIALNQPEEGVRGLKITKEELGLTLNLNRTYIFRDLKWLKDNLLIQELKFVDDFDFMANPRFVMNNSDFKERMEEWNRRQHLDIQREIALKKKRRARQAKND